jgi:hypothetical protein
VPGLRSIGRDSVERVAWEGGDRPNGEIGTWRTRTPYKPINVGALAELRTEE